MENASKALIIAAAILIAIVLISLGVYVIGVAQSQIQDTGLDDFSNTAFNQKFTKYEGENVKGSTIRTMVQQVMANNNSAQASDETMVSIITKSGTENIVKLEAGADKTPTYGSLKNTKTYKVECKYKNGKVNEIEISNSGS